MQWRESPQTCKTPSPGIHGSMAESSRRQYSCSLERGLGSWMTHLPIPAGYSEPVSHPTEHSNIRKLGLLEGCCSCCYSFSYTCYTGHSHLQRQVLWKCSYILSTIILKDRNLHAVLHVHITAAHWMLLMILQLLKELTVQWNPLTIFMEKCNKSPYSAKKHCKSVILKIMSICNYISKLAPSF